MNGRDEDHWGFGSGERGFAGGDIKRLRGHTDEDVADGDKVRRYRQDDHSECEGEELYNDMSIGH